MGSTGEVVCDSILQNKHKTKTYWEQMMMAATTSELPKAQYHAGPLKHRSVDSLTVGVEADDNKLASELSEQEYYDARSQISLNSPVGTVDHLDDSGPKIVETVAKKLIEVDNIKLVSTGDGSVIARDIRVQKEREETLIRDRERALQKAVVAPQVVLVQGAVVLDAAAATAATMSSPTPASAESKIAMELREMREREEELRALRQSLTVCKEDEDLMVTAVVTDDTFNSIPNTDEGNYSEYGSEEKELSLDGNNSRMMSPEVPSQVNFLHTRTQSMDSMSSGHSSGSGSGPGSGPGSAPHEPAYHTSSRGRRITVKPYEEPEEDEEVPTYMRGRVNSVGDAPLIAVVGQLDKSDAGGERNLHETPIEREIRLARERESELRREQRLPPPGVQTSPGVAAKQEVRRPHKDAITNDPRSVQHRLATNRIQQEINEATEREKELRSAGTIQTTSEDTVDSKVTRFTDLAEYSIEEQDRKMQRAVSTSHIPSPHASSTPHHPAKPPSSLALNELNHHRATLNRSVSTNILTSPTAPSPSRRFGSSSGQKGIMERFLASRGKLTGVTTTFAGNNNSSPSLGSSPRSPAARPISPIPRHDGAPKSLPTLATPKAVLDVTPIAERQVTLDNDEREREKERSTPLRKGYTSAEDKIQAELQEMRRREEELRLQRARMFAQSQPNLLTIMDDDSDDADHQPMSNEDFDSPMSIGSLRASLSNPNLLDSEENDISEKFQPSNKSARKRNALIAEWENRIQKFTVEH